MKPQEHGVELTLCVSYFKHYCFYNIYSHKNIQVLSIVPKDHVVVEHILVSERSYHSKMGACPSWTVLVCTRVVTPRLSVQETLFALSTVLEVMHVGMLA